MFAYDAPRYNRISVFKAKPKISFRVDSPRGPVHFRQEVVKLPTFPSWYIIELQDQNASELVAFRGLLRMEPNVVVEAEGSDNR